MRTFINSLFLLAFVINVHGQDISVREENVALPTYPFSDPDPVARPGTIYPYFRFDGFSLVPVEQRHRMVVMENRWIKVWIAPDMGGKIYGALDKKTGKYFIYFNNVVKFRDIALRGPWTSGGIELNFGSIGHAPTTATPVDFCYQFNSDGSVSCYLGALELTSRTEWQVEVRLPADKAWFETRSCWNNPTSQKTSLYHWQTAAADATYDLQYYFPGKAYIDHSGNAFSWPVMSDGRDISLYRNNNYGTDHSYHVLGEYTDWFAGYYHDSETGFGHWSRYPYKPGKKIWIWALSRQGEIWKHLLTDSARGNEQYTEIQTGLLFNQEEDGSTMSPFKHSFLMPGAVESFSERWFPIGKTRGVVSISPEGILNIEKKENGFRLLFQSLGYITDILQIADSTGRLLYEYKLEMEPLQVFDMPVDHKPENITIKIRNGELFYEAGTSKRKLLDRPLEISPGFNWNSVYGLYTKGIEKSRQRLYNEAKEYFNKCLAKDPDYLPAFTQLAEIDFREMNYKESEKKLMRVLSFDTYDPDANYLYGTILALKKEYNKAKDAFGVTLRSPGYKSASFNQLAMIALKEKHLEEAWEYSMNALLYNGMDNNNYKTAVVTARLRNDRDNYTVLLQRLSSRDPLSHFAAFEKYYTSMDSVSLHSFISGINTELKYETYIELALWYYNAGLVDEALDVMKLSPEHPMADYLTAYLAYRKGDELKTVFYFDRAVKASINLVFPYRYEYDAILKWADQRQYSWKTKYCLALLYWNIGQPDTASRYFRECQDKPGNYIFYLTRASFAKQVGRNEEEDYLKALKYGQKYWRPYHMLHGYYLSVYNYKKALAISIKAMKLFPESYIIKSDHALSLLNAGKYDDCIKLLKNTEILPNEGAGYGRTLWRQANLLEAIRLIESGKTEDGMEKISSARLWPEKLGVGRPYIVNESFEDLLESFCLAREGKMEMADKLISRACSVSQEDLRGGTETLASIIALKAMKKEKEADERLSIWSEKVTDKIVKIWALNLFSATYEGKKENQAVRDIANEQAIVRLPKQNPDFYIIEKIFSLYSGRR